MNEALDLNRDECVRMLRAGVAGRVALTTPTGPHIVPVNYTIIDDATVLRTTPYSILGTYGRGTMLAFEIDHFDVEHRHGWSVVARGRAQLVDDAAELEEINRVWPARPWARGQRNLVLRIPWAEVSGRRLGDDWDPWAEAPLKRHA
jgi:nitroimidazol reductase NimA-like FMN-containing flavoprotein (pyridoxamine 5'-phosphate oxidase superfamily)